jgi:hypothetical protein
MIAAAIQRDDVVNFISRNQFVVQKALLTQRMPLDIQVADGVPAAAIKFVRVGRAVLVVLAAGSSFVGGAIAALANGGGAAGVGAGVQGSVGHGETTSFSYAENSEFL